MILLNHIAKSFTSFGARHEVLKDLCFQINSGEIISIVGPNGCGKSTLLRLIAGLIKPDSGSINFKTADNDKPLIGFIHQGYRESLFTWRTVRDNIRLSFESTVATSMPKADIDRFIDNIMEQLYISDLSERRPGSLSGGQAQLVTIARAIVHPQMRVLLMDEPFSALDGRNLHKAASEVVAISRKNNASTIVITHDLDVGILIGDRIAVITSEAKGVAAVIDAPFKSCFDLDLIVDKRFLTCKREVLRALYPNGKMS
jgi:ABC-type nitrate/sulfonate/bicarbonate transport system ATPase subunit